MLIRALGAISVALGLAAIVHSTSFTSHVAASIAHSRGCIARLVDGPAQSAQVLILGSSRTRQAVDPEVLAKVWHLPPQSVVNAAHPDRLLWVDYALLKRASRTGKLRLAIIELQAKSTGAQRRENELRNNTGTSEPRKLELAGGTVRRAAVTIMEYADAHSLAGRHSLGFILSTYDWLKIEAIRLKIALKAVLTPKVFIRTYINDKRINRQRHNICGLKKIDRDEHLRPKPEHQRQKDAFEAMFKKLNLQGWEKAPEPANDYFEAKGTRIERKALERIIGLAHRRNFTVVFAYMPTYFMLSPGSSFQERFMEKTGVEFVAPPRSVQRKLHSHYYHPTHLNRFGGRLYSRWLVHELSKRIPKLKRLGRDNKL